MEPRSRPCRNTCWRGEKRASALGNRGPIRFAAGELVDIESDLHDILGAAWRFFRRGGAGQWSPQRCPDEAPFTYKPHLDDGLTYRRDDTAKEDLPDDNLLDLSI